MERDRGRGMHREEGGLVVVTGAKWGVGRGERNGGEEERDVRTGKGRRAHVYSTLPGGC